MRIAFPGLRGVCWPVFALAASCSPPPYDTSPQVTILWPPPEAVVASCVTVVANITNFSLVDNGVNREPVDGQGHFHVEYPNSYALCLKPYCLVDLSDAVTDTPELTVALVGNDHQPVLNSEGVAIRQSVIVNRTADPCTEGVPEAYDSGWSDSGAAR